MTPFSYSIGIIIIDNMKTTDQETYGTASVSPNYKVHLI